MKPISNDLAAGRGPAESSRPARWIFRVCALAAVAPITVAAVRNGLNGWEPTWDAATVAARTRDVFSAHPPLIGFVAAPSSSSQLYSFPGAPQLYLLALPVKVLGTTWGMLLGAAAINTAALLVALWLIRRRVGDVGAVVATGFIASVLWSFGSEFIIDASPVQAITLPFFTLLAAAWAVADGDTPALVPLAIVGNYLFLGHLALAVVAPLVVLVGLASGGIRLRQQRRDDPGAWRASRRRLLGWSAGAAGVSVAMWLPPVYEQFSRPDGNLGLLARALVHGGGGTGTGSWSGALGTVTSVAAVPPFWLPPNFASPPFDWVGGGRSAALRLVCGLATAAIGILAWRWSRHRGDRTVSAAFGVIVAALVGWAISWRVNPTSLFPTHYFWGLWPTAAFIWFIFTWVGMRALAPIVTARRPELRRWAVASMCVGVAAMTILALPRRNNCPGHCASSVDALVPAAREARAATADAMRGQRAVLVPSSTLTYADLQPALVLGLQDAGVDIRADNPFDVRQLGPGSDNRIRGDATMRLVFSASSQVPEPGARQIAALTRRPAISAGRFDELDRNVTAWLKAAPPLRTLARQIARQDEPVAIFAMLADTFAAEAEATAGTMPLARYVANLAALGRKPNPKLLRIEGLSNADLRSWAIEATRRESGTVHLWTVPIH